MAIATTWPDAESIHVIPDNACTFGTSGGSMFSAIYPNGLAKFPARLVTIWVYGFDITINDATHEYAGDFDSSLYGLPNGTALDVNIYIGGVLAGTARLNLN